MGLEDILQELAGNNLRLQREIERLKRLPNYIDLISPFLALPGLRGFWPMSAFDSSGNAQDQSGHAHHVTWNGTTAFSYDTTYFSPHMDLDGASDYFSRADEADLDITGTEAFINTTERGLVTGGWTYPTALTGATRGLISKWNTTGSQRSYALFLNSSNQFEFSISSDGTSGNVSTIASSVSLSVQKYYFVVGRFDPSTEVAIWVNGIKASNTTSIKASIFNSTAPLEIGAMNGGTSLYKGRVSLMFLAAMMLSDSYISNLFQSTRGGYGV